jgi:quinol monooxygenase YgiN
MVELLVRLTAAPGRSKGLIQALRSVRGSLQLDGVCQGVRVASDVDDADVVWFCEEWPGIVEFEQHLRSPSFARLLAVVETAATPPWIECRVVSETRGLEYLAAMRSVVDTDVRGSARAARWRAGG